MYIVHDIVELIFCMYDNLYVLPDLLLSGHMCVHQKLCHTKGCQTADKDWPTKSKGCCMTWLALAERLSSLSTGISDEHFSSAYCSW